MLPNKSNLSGLLLIALLSFWFIIACANNKPGFNLPFAGTASVLNRSNQNPLNYNSPPAVPNLLLPAEGTTMDNGCRRTVAYECHEKILWEFKWSEVTGATQYQLYVIGSGPKKLPPHTIRQKIYPTIDVKIKETTYLSKREATIEPGFQESWRWKVRAKVDGKWGEWSSERTFSVEPTCMDCKNTPLY